MSLGHQTCVQEEMGIGVLLMSSISYRAVLVCTEVADVRRPALGCINACRCAFLERLQACKACRNWAGRAPASASA
jgi:hypothetical protein